jgi:hypothetical protein|tara:strand:+ start:549 stop:851 length:303 start_codon:yes stop_codon:yes gene_type:complete
MNTYRINIQNLILKAHNKEHAEDLIKNLSLDNEIPHDNLGFKIKAQRISYNCVMCNKQFIKMRLCTARFCSSHCQYKFTRICEKQHINRSFTQGEPKNEK